MVNWWKSPKQIARAFDEQRNQARKEYREAAERYGRSYADSIAGDLHDSHACVDFSANGGHCSFCGAIIPGSPADREARGHDDADAWEV